MVKHPKTGQIVYVNSTYTTAEKCIIKEIREETDRDGSSVTVCHVKSLDHAGAMDARKENCFKTWELAIKAESERSTKALQEYLKEIDSIDALLDFPLKHCLNGEEYTEEEAVEAYKIKCNYFRDRIKEASAMKKDPL